MRCQVIMLEGGKTIRCANPECGLVRGSVVFRPEFSHSEGLEHDVLLFCRKKCFDEYYALHPVVPKITHDKK